MNSTVNYDNVLCHPVEMGIKEDFAHRFKKVIKDSWPGLKQSEIAKRFGVSQATVSDWVNAVKMPGTEKLIEICLMLDVCVEWMATGRGPKIPPEPLEMPKTLTEEQKKFLREITDLVCK